VIASLGRSDLSTYGYGASWIESQSFDVTDYLAQKLRALSATDEERILLLTYLDESSGGFGGSTNFGANNLDTALALQALLAIGSTDTGLIARVGLPYIIPERGRRVGIF